MLKILHDGDYAKYLDHQKEKLDVYLKHTGKKMALDMLVQRHYKALTGRLQTYNLKGKSVLCLGARLGQEVRAFRRCGAFAVGIDLNPGPQNPYVHHGDFHNIQFASKSVDMIYTNSLDHTFDFNKLIKEIKRVIKDDGILMLEIQVGDNSNVPAEQYEAHWWDSVDDVIDMFVEAGFNTIQRDIISIPFKSISISMTLSSYNILNTPVEVKFQKEIPTRDELSKLAFGTSLELGVSAGDYSETLLKNKKIKRLYSIDRWSNDGKHNDAQYLQVLHRFKKYKSRSIIIRREFEMAVSIFNSVFDFIYIDGYAHTGQDGGKTLRQWWPKLKPGGIFAGHDYHSRWQPTIDAVNQFVKEYKLELFLTKEYDQASHVYPSWYIFKPE